MKCTRRRDAFALGVFVFKALAAVAGAGAVGCDAKPEGRTAAVDTYGDPVGIRIGAQGTVPALNVAVAVTKGRDPSPSVPSLATAIHGAALACPGFVAAMTAGKAARVELGARKGLFEALGASTDDVGGACMSAALGGKAVAMDRPDPMDLMVELRLDRPADASP